MVKQSAGDVKSSPRYVKFIEANVPGTACNFKCSYCYIAQAEGTEHRNAEKPRYSPEVIGKALRKERLGGCAYINICGVGETLLPKEMPEIIKEILKQGHFVNIYTNGTITRAFDAICCFDKTLLDHLCFSFSLHWIELKEKNLLETFTSNIRKVRAVGCSIVCNMVFDDSYLPYIDEIKSWAKKNIGALPQISYPKKWNSSANYSPLTKDVSKLEQAAEGFDSPYFRFTREYFNYDKSRFCYAGKWSFLLDLFSGNISQCYNHPPIQNIYEDVYAPIVERPVGPYCQSSACGGGLMLPQGLVPSLKAPSYSMIKNRVEANWYTKSFSDFLSQQLDDNNEQYSRFYELYCELKHKIRSLASRITPTFVKRFARSVIIKTTLLKNIIVLRYRWRNMKAFLVGTPLHENIGDNAIVMAEFAFLKDAGVKPEEMCELPGFSAVDSPVIRHAIPKNSLILYHGGGNMGDEYYNEEYARQQMLKYFSKNPSVIFPQTIYYKKSVTGDFLSAMSVPVYSARNISAIFARETYSYNVMKKLYPLSNVVLVPDIVLSAPKDVFKISGKDRSGVVLCFRSDAEKTISNNTVSDITSCLQGLGVSYTFSDMFADKLIPANARADYVNAKLSEFASAKLVITDRLHGMVFSAIAETPVIVFSNYNKKVIGTYEWIKDLPYVKFAENAEQAIKYIPELLEMHDCHYDNGKLLPYFTELKNKIKEKLA